jgi:hypothetical protein
MVLELVVLKYHWYCNVGVPVPPLRFTVAVRLFSVPPRQMDCAPEGDTVVDWGQLAEVTVTASVEAALVEQLFVAVTLIFPFWPAFPEVTVMETVPCPPVMLHPGGTVQV